MNFRELKIETEELLKLWGFTNTQPTPDYGMLVNRAYRKVVWESEVLKDTVTFDTDIDIPEYTLPDYDWKSITDCILENVYLEQESEDRVREYNPYWLSTSSSKPTCWWYVGTNKIRLYPTPSTVYTISIRGTHTPPLLTDDDDIPLLPEVYHEDIPLGAAYYHLRKYCKGDAQITQKETILRDFLTRINDLKTQTIGNRIDGSKKSSAYGSIGVYI